jgi:hypothetical protein
MEDLAHKGVSTDAEDAPSTTAEKKSNFASLVLDETQGSTEAEWKLITAIPESTGKTDEVQEQTSDNQILFSRALTTNREVTANIAFLTKLIGI